MRIMAATAALYDREVECRRGLQPLGASSPMFASRDDNSTYKEHRVDRTRTYAFQTPIAFAGQPGPAVSTPGGETSPPCMLPFNASGLDPNETSFEAFAFLPSKWLLPAGSLQFLTDILTVLPRELGEITLPLWDLTSDIPPACAFCPYFVADPARNYAWYRLGAAALLDPSVDMSFRSLMGGKLRSLRTLEPGNLLARAG
jgi:hypothetical protein